VTRHPTWRSSASSATPATTFTGTAGSRYVESQLFGVHANDPAVFAVSAFALLAAALAAGFVPAWRAARIDPMRALRYD
jgi:ABC-type antimicrobial peptide transport system permease subunit